MVAVTNYTDQDCDYLNKLIQLMGGTFTWVWYAEDITIVVAAWCVPRSR